MNPACARLIALHTAIASWFGQATSHPTAVVVVYLAYNASVLWIGDRGKS